MQTTTSEEKKKQENVFEEKWLFVNLYVKRKKNGQYLPKFTLNIDVKKTMNV
jgi:hypothetical protein